MGVLTQRDVLDDEDVGGLGLGRVVGGRCGSGRGGRRGSGVLTQRDVLDDEDVGGLALRRVRQVLVAQEARGGDVTVQQHHLIVLTRQCLKVVRPGDLKHTQVWESTADPRFIGEMPINSAKLMYHQRPKG